MKANNTLKGQALRTYNKVMNAMAEDNDASMLHTFAALTQQAKSIALQSGKFSNAYVRGELKGMTAEEAAKDLTARAAACVSCKVRNIDMVIATAFLAEYISRQRKDIETPKPTTPETTETMNTENTPATMNEAITNELGHNEATRCAMIDAARAFLSLADDLNEEVSAYIDGSNRKEAEAAYYAVKEAEANFLKYNNAYWGENRRPCLGYELAESALPEDDEYFNA